eukprot:126964_1
MAERKQNNTTTTSKSLKKKRPQKKKKRKKPHTAMAERKQNNTTTTSKSPKKKRPQKIFGVMTKRRWFGVLVFLSAMLWSYTAGPPLPDSIICNRYFLDGTSYDYSTVQFEGNINLIDSIFKRGFWPAVFTWQIGAYFDWTEGPLWSNKYGKLIFSDIIQNKIFSWSPINGIQIEIDNAGQCTQDQLDKLYEPGTNGILQHPNNQDIIFITQHAQRRIISYNLATKESKVIADKYNGKRFNSPNDLVIGPDNKFIYFTDPPYGLKEKSRDDPNDPNHFYVDSNSDIGFNGIFRVGINGGNVELLYDGLKRPNGIVFSSDFKKLFVSDCIHGEFKLNVFNFDGKKGNIKLDKLWDEKYILRNDKSGINSLLGGIGCVDGLTIINDKYLVTTCPGGKLCLITQNNGDLEAIIKLPDKTHLSNVAVGDDRNLYITGNHTVWQIKLQTVE